ncbi:hypothetical protein [Sulfurimonas sp.]
MLNVNNMFKKLSLLLLLTSFSYAEGLFEKPFATCESMRSLGVYKTTKAAVATCKTYNVNIDFKKARKGFDKMITNDDFPAGECRIKCAIVEAFEGKKLSSCVENNYVDSFVNGFVGSLNSQVCSNIKSQLGA